MLELLSCSAECILCNVSCRCSHCSLCSYIPLAVPRADVKMEDIDTNNGTSLIIYWEPVPDTRDSVGGRVHGYRVSKNIHLLILIDNIYGSRVQSASLTWKCA